jgi:predicted ATPase
VKVTKLHIDEYKVFKDFDIDFTDKEGKAQNLIVLAGINGTGKTTLLEFIYSLLYTRLAGIPSNNSGQLGVTKSYIEINGAIIDTFNSMRIAGIDNNNIRFYYNNAIIDSDFIAYNSPNDIKFFSVFNRINQSDFSSDFGDDFTNRLQEEILLGNYIRKCILEENMRAFEAYENLQNFLNNILSDFNTDIKFSRLDYQENPFFSNKATENLTLENLSLGERQMFFYAINLFVAGIKDSIILIDEPEFSLHPSWQNKIVGVLQKYADEYNCQVILATHSPHIIGSVKPEQLRLLYKDESGAIKVKDYVGGSYGWPVDRVLVGLMDMDGLRTPEAVRDLKELNELARGNQYDTDEFKTKMQKLEDSIGADDEYLTAIRFEIVKRRKEGATNS